MSTRQVMLDKGAHCARVPGILSWCICAHDTSQATFITDELNWRTAHLTLPLLLLLLHLAGDNEWTDCDKPTTAFGRTWNSLNRLTFLRSRFFNNNPYSQGKKKILQEVQVRLHEYPCKLC